MSRKPFQINIPDSDGFPYLRTHPLSEGLDHCSGLGAQYAFDLISTEEQTPDLEKIYFQMQRLKPDLWLWWHRNA